MFRRRTLGLLLLLSLFFVACQKTDVANAGDYKTLGTSAHNLLVASPYSSLLVEIQYMPGYQPDDASMATLQTFLNQYLNKPGGIKVVETPIPSSGKTTLSLKDAVSIEKKYRTAFTNNNQIAVHILITDGSYDSSNIFATSYWNTSICVFGKTVAENSGFPGFISRSQLFAVLFEHEFGHLLGLVNQGSPMQTNHQDVANGAHCINKKCVMYYDVETSSFSTSSTSPSLDTNCIADLRANGGK